MIRATETDRRRFLRALAATGLVSSAAGCSQLDGSGSSNDFAANPAGLDEGAAQAGYALLDHREVSGTPAPVDASGGVPEMTISNQIASYERTGAALSPGALAVLAAPSATAEGTEYNALLRDPPRHVVAGRWAPIHPWPHASADATAHTDSLPLLYGGLAGSASWQRGPTRVAQREATMLEESTTLSSYAGVTDEDVFVLAHLARVVVDEEAVLVVAVGVRDAAGATGKQFVGSDGFVTDATLDASAEETVDALQYVIRGRVPELSTGGTGDVRVLDEQLSVTGSGVTERASLRVRAENVGDERLEFAEIVPEFYTSSGELLAIEQGEQFFVDPGETFEQHVPVGGPAAEIASHSVSANSKRASRSEALGDVTLESDRLETTDDEAFVEGTVRNDGQAREYVGVRVKFYADGVLVGDGDAHVTDLPAGDSWQFTVDYSEDGHEPFGSVTDHSVELVGQWWWQH